MRKSCVQPVDDLRMIRGHEHYLYPASRPVDAHKPQPSPTYPHYPQAEPTALSTEIQRQINLLYSQLPTISTGLITNTIN